jgi:hypothetical protein
LAGSFSCLSGLPGGHLKPEKTQLALSLRLLCPE